MNIAVHKNHKTFYAFNIVNNNNHNCNLSYLILIKYRIVKLPSDLIAQTNQPMYFVMHDSQLESVYYASKPK